MYECNKLQFIKTFDKKEMYATNSVKIMQNSEFFNFTTHHNFGSDNPNQIKKNSNGR